MNNRQMFREGKKKKKKNTNRKMTKLLYKTNILSFHIHIMCFCVHCYLGDAVKK